MPSPCVYGMCQLADSPDEMDIEPDDEVPFMGIEPDEKVPFMGVEPDDDIPAMGIESILSTSFQAQ